MYEEVVEASACGPERPLACLYDFLAIGSRTGAVLEDLAGRGWSVGPLISERVSPHFWLDWVHYLIEEDRVRSSACGCGPHC